MIKASSAVFAFVIAASIVGVGDGAVAQSMPDSENGRYALSPIPDGVIRLDTRTGAVSTCNNNGTGWACYSAPDERAALDAEIGRLLSNYPEIAKAKMVFAGATVTAIKRSVEDPLKAVWETDSDLNDDVGF